MQPEEFQSLKCEKKIEMKEKMTNRICTYVNHEEKKNYQKFNFSDMSSKHTMKKKILKMRLAMESKKKTKSAQK